MNTISLAEVGKELASKLKSLSKEFHVKSDHYEILLWEIAVIQAKVKDITENCGIQNKFLKESVLISSWGTSATLISPEIRSKVTEFHKHYEVFKHKD